MRGVDHLRLLLLLLYRCWLWLGDDQLRIIFKVHLVFEYSKITTRLLTSFKSEIAQWKFDLVQIIPTFGNYLKIMTILE